MQLLLADVVSCPCHCMSASVIAPWVLPSCEEFTKISISTFFLALYLDYAEPSPVKTIVRRWDERVHYFKYFFLTVNSLKFELYFSWQFSAFSFWGGILAIFLPLSYLIYNNATSVFVYVLCLYTCIMLYMCVYIYCIIPPVLCINLLCI